MKSMVSVASKCDWSLGRTVNINDILFFKMNRFIQRILVDDTEQLYGMWRLLTMCLWHVSDSVDHLHNFTFNSHDYRCLLSLWFVSIHAESLHFFSLGTQKYNKPKLPNWNGYTIKTADCLSLWCDVIRTERHSVWLSCVCVWFTEWFEDGGTWEFMTRLAGGGDEVTSLWSLFSVLKISEVGRPDLHLCKFNWVFVALPVEPVDPLWKNRKSTNDEKEARKVRYLTLQSHLSTHTTHITEEEEILLEQSDSCLYYTEGEK